MSLHAALERTAAAAPAAALTFVSEHEELRVDQLCEQSRTMAGALARNGIRQRDRVGVLCANESAFFRCLFALSRLGATACPLPLPTTGRDGYVAKIRGVLAVADVRVVLVSRKLDRLRRLVGDAVGDARVIVVDDLPAAAAVDGVDIAEQDDLIVQFTSGSTASPKGVRLTHANVLAGVDAIRTGIDLGRPGDLPAIWLPLFHDMGLFGTLTALLTGVSMSVWAPSAFVKDPARWLRAISDGGYTAWALPNFGYDYLRRAVPADEVADYDLSRLRVALNGAEPIAPDSVAAFTEHFVPAGFRPEAMLVVYGLAEATLAVTFPELGTRPVVDWVDRAALTGDRRARPVAAGAPGARGVVALGSPVKGLDVRIADPDDCRPLGERSLGEVQVRGRSVTTGYLGATVQPFSADGWLRTGDLGYFAGGQLYVTGRSKEMLIVRGGNFYPEDIEAAARTDPGVHRRRCVAFVSDDDGDGIIVLVAESLVDSGVERDELTGRLRERVKAVTGLDRLRVVLVGPHAIPRTSSGKLQRIASRTAFT